MHLSSRSCVLSLSPSQKPKLFLIHFFKEIELSCTSTSVQFVPTADMISTAETCFAAMAVEQYIGAIVIAYQRKILTERVYSVREEYAEALTNRAGEPERIFCAERAYLMSEADFSIYLARCEEERIKATLTIEKEGQCPLLVARNDTMLAEKELVNSVSKITGITADQCITLNFKKYKQMVELVLNLDAPFVGTGAELLTRILAPGQSAGPGAIVAARSAV